MANSYYCRSFKKPNHNGRGSQMSGQTAVEYILLLVVVTIVAGLVMSQCVSRDEGEPGVLIDVWNKVLNAIGADDATSPQK